MCSHQDLVVVSRKGGVGGRRMVSQDLYTCECQPSAGPSGLVCQSRMKFHDSKVLRGAQADRSSLRQHKLVLDAYAFRYLLRA